MDTGHVCTYLTYLAPNLPYPTNIDHRRSNFVVYIHTVLTYLPTKVQRPHTCMFQGGIL